VSVMDLSRRGVLVGIGVLFNAAVGLLLAVPIVGYILSPVIRQRRTGYESWLSLGPLSQFPVGQTRLATYRNPVASPTDGETANIPCWVRNVDGRQFQVFAINCAHLGCPVRWFPQSGLFMCPCHGGLFTYSYKLNQGNLLINAGEMPTTGSPTAGLTNITAGRQPCA
jgi:Rieske Fe-S protein